MWSYVDYVQNSKGIYCVGLMCLWSKMVIPCLMHCMQRHRTRLKQTRVVCLNYSKSVFVLGSYSAQGTVTYRRGSFFYQHLLLGIFFTASAMDEKSAVFLDSLDVPFIKIGSGDVNNLRLLKLGKEKFSEMLF